MFQRNDSNQVLVKGLIEDLKKERRARAKLERKIEACLRVLESPKNERRRVFDVIGILTDLVLSKRRRA